MTWPFDTFNASPLSAFVESPLGERGATADEFGYAMGGYRRLRGRITQLDRVDRYDFAADLWSRAASLLKMPATSKLAAFAAGSKGYFVGSLNVRADFFDYRYNTWSEVEDGVPGGAANASTGIAHKHKVYVIFAGVNRPHTYQYDPAANSWERRANYPTKNSKGEETSAKWNSVACSIGDKCYFYAGEPINNVWPGDMLIEYEPATDTWELKKDMLREVFLAAGGELDGEAYLQGGELQNSDPTAGAMSYLPSTDTWRNRLGGIVRQEHDAFTLSQVDSSIFLVCGATDFGWRPLIAGTTEFNSKRNSWTKKDDTTARVGHACWAI